MATFVSNVSSEVLGLSESLSDMIFLAVGLVVGITILGIIISVISRFFGLTKEEESEPEIEAVESKEESNIEDFEEGESEEPEIFKKEEVFHKKPRTKEKPKVDMPESKMTEKDFNKSEFD